MELNQELERLAGLRAQLVEAEAPLAPLKEEIEITEKAIKEHVSATGEVAEAGGLRVQMVAGRVTYDGHALHDMAGMLLDSLKALHGGVWGLSGLGADEKVEGLSNTLEGITSLVQRMIDETTKAGAPSIQIAAMKAKKES